MKMNVLKAAAMAAVVLVGSVSADMVWTGAGEDNLWSNAANWSGTGNIVLNANNDAGDDLVVIDSATNVTYNAEIYGPEWGLHLDIDGGSLTQTFTSDPWMGFVFAPIGDTANPSVVNVRNGGLLHVQELLVGDNWWFTAAGVILNVYDTSSVITNGWLWLGGKINLYDGVLDIGGQINMAVNTASLGYTNLNIENGTVIIRGADQSAAIADWIASGYLTAFGGAGNILVDTTTLPGGTIITAEIPEPATLSLLGLGVLAMLKKRK